MRRRGGKALKSAAIWECRWGNRGTAHGQGVRTGCSAAGRSIVLDTYRDAPSLAAVVLGESQDPCRGIHP